MVCESSFGLLFFDCCRIVPDANRGGGRRCGEQLLITTMLKVVLCHKTKALKIGTMLPDFQVFANMSTKNDIIQVARITEKIPSS